MQHGMVGCEFGNDMQAEALALELLFWHTPEGTEENHGDTSVSERSFPPPPGQYSYPWSHE
jgi:hypothetical protein